MKQAINQLWRVLTFRTTAEDVASWGYWELGLGLVCTLLVGIGRWWDDPRDLPFVAKSGLGSVAYVLVFAGVLWLTIRPIVDNPPTIRQLLTFVCFVSPPAALYAIPVERWTGMDVARTMNMWFLLLVAVYRLSLLLRFCRKALMLTVPQTVLATFLPVSIGIFWISAMNLTSVVIDFMGGASREELPNRRAEMEFAVHFFSCFSWVVTPVLAGCYLIMVITRLLERRKGNRL